MTRTLPRPGYTVAIAFSTKEPTIMSKPVTNRSPQTPQDFLMMLDDAMRAGTPFAIIPLRNPVDAPRELWWPGATACVFVAAADAAWLLEQEPHLDWHGKDTARQRRRLIAAIYPKRADGTLNRSTFQMIKNAVLHLPMGTRGVTHHNDQEFDCRPENLIYRAKRKVA